MAVTQKKRKFAAAEPNRRKAVKAVPSHEEEETVAGSTSDASSSDSEDSIDALSDSSEDELDGGDYENAESADSGSENDSDNEQAAKRLREDPEKPRHEEQRLLKKERKLSRKNGQQIDHIKQLWEKLRVRKDMPSDKRAKLVTEIWQLCEHVVQDLVLKHDASRVIQTIFKYGDKPKRLAITKALKGHYYDLARSPYGKYLLVKMLHYGSRDVRQEILDELFGKFRRLMKHKEGAHVLEDCYRDYASAAQRRQILREFYGSSFAVFRDSPDAPLAELLAADQSGAQRGIIMRNLLDTFRSAVQKGSLGFSVIHAALLQYVQVMNDTEKTEIVELIAEQFPEIVHTSDGSQTACILLSRATAKERKQLIKALRPFAAEAAKDEYGCLVLITLFAVVDDTKLVAKAFGPALLGEDDTGLELLRHKYGRRPLLYLLLGLSPRYFARPVREQLEGYVALSSATSKKDADLRLSELRQNFSGSLLELISRHVSELLRDNLGSQFVAEALLYCVNDDACSQLKYSVCRQVAEAFGTGSIHDITHLIRAPFSTRLLRTLIQGGHWNGKEQRIEKVDVRLVAEDGTEATFPELFLEATEEKLGEWCVSDGSFVVVALLEAAEPDVRKRAIKQCRKVKKNVAEAAEKGNKGCALLLKILD